MQNILHDSLVLNVDDNDGARYAKSKILSRAGMKVIEARNGGEALDKALSEQPDLILLDTRLPDLNGFEVCRRLKTDPATSAIIILQTSASFLKVADKINALDGGADNYLFEPMEPEELVANVKALLRLSKVERQLRDVDRRKDEFLATLAHELRNPLGPIRNAVKVLETLNPDASALQKNSYDIILRQTEHMVRLVDDLLDVSRITLGKIALQVGPIELQAFAHNVIEASRPLIAARRHTLTVSLPDTPTWFDGDAVRLAQVVGNLLNNAAKFTAPEGKIDLTIAATADQVRVRVSDNGIGLAPASLENIFELFVQEGHVHDRVQDGLGIGLSLVKKLVEMHQGTISVSSAGMGHGSQFEVVLPATLSTGALAAVDNAAAPAIAASRILVVDDNEDAAQTLAELLTLYGNEVHIAYTGTQALADVLAFAPDIVFLDIGLPDLDGYAVAARMRAMPALDGTQLVALTGYGREEDRQRTLEAGFDEHFVKPLDFSRLDLLTRGRRR